MTAREHQGAVVPEVTIYDARAGADIRFTDIRIDSSYARDDAGRVMYFDVQEGPAYLGERGKSVASLPLLVNLYIALADMAGRDEAAAMVLGQLNSGWDRTGTTVDPATGSIAHADCIVGEIEFDGLDVPLEGNSAADLYGRYPFFFQALLGVRDLDRLCAVAGDGRLTPFYWYPRGRRHAMFGGGNFYYMHQNLPGLLMIFCDDEPHPRRVLRGVWQEETR